MKKLVALLAVFALVGIGIATLIAASPTGSWTGEVIDVACHSAKGAKGKDHMDCGQKCVKGGLPVGLLVGDTTYLLVSSDHKPLNATLAEHVGHMIMVKGEKYEAKGANVIIVKEWAMAK